VGERPSTVEDFVKSYRLNYQVLLDRDSSVASRYGIVGIPAYILVDKQGFIVFQDSYLPYNEYKELISEEESQDQK
jgi:hypothetical protein